MVGEDKVSAIDLIEVVLLTQGASQWWSEKKLHQAANQLLICVPPLVTRFNSFDLGEISCFRTRSGDRLLDKIRIITIARRFDLMREAGTDEVDIPDFDVVGA